MDNREVSDKSYVARDVQPTVLRLHPDVRAALVRLATINGRSLSKEIALRLDASLKADSPPSYTAPSTATVLTTLHEPGAQTKGPADPLSEIDRAMLAIFRRLSVEKQLALLSLFN
jgi:hypothetical protein